MSTKLRSLFFSSVAHELRTPLNSIIPLTNILMQAIGSSGENRKYLEIIMNSARHLESVIEDALDMSRIENGNFEINIQTINIS